MTPAKLSNDEVVAKVRAFFATGDGDRPSLEETYRALNIYKGPLPPEEAPKLKWRVPGVDFPGEAMCQKSHSNVPERPDLIVSVRFVVDKKRWFYEAKILGSGECVNAGAFGWADEFTKAQVLAERALILLLQQEEVYAKERVDHVAKILGVPAR